MSKKTIILSILVLTVMVGTGCGKKAATTQPAAKNNPAEIPQIIAKDCGEDSTCANALIADCQLGKFVSVEGRSKVFIEIKNKNGETCSMNQAIALADLGGFGGDYDVNKDGKISMDCQVPTSIKTFQALSDYMKTPAGLAGCTGELKKLGDDMNKAE